MKSTLLIFLDGVGIGEADPRSNPFFKYKFRIFNEIFPTPPSLDNQYMQTDGKYLFPTDACMGVADLPQSGTGQTSIFCGVNAPEIVGHHFGPYPYSTLIPVIKEKNILQEYLNRRKKVSFVNAYPKIFFDYVNSGRTRLSVTTLSCIKSGVPLKNRTDLVNGKALSAEIDNRRWVENLGYKLPIIKPVTAARRLLKMAGQNHFTMYEFFLTDHLGHGRYPDLKKYTLHILDEFLYHVFQNLSEELSLVICSDHGNLEDTSVKTHTRNPALTITAGRNAKKLSEKINYLYDIKDAILEVNT
ncbi:metalloenzyme [Bacteroidota bacterium]